MSTTPLPDPFVVSPKLSVINEITIAGINHPSLFLPIPATDPLNALLTKYIPVEVRPQRDLVGRYEEQTLDTLVMSNSWRALARMAKDQIVATPESDTALILDLWSLRISALARMRLFNQATAECSNLYSVLGTVSPPSTLRRLVPYELDILRARTMYWSGDMRSYLDELVRLLKMCKRATRAGGGIKGADGAVWAERGTRTGMLIAAQLVEMQDYTNALSILQSLAESEYASSELVFALARITMESGDSIAAHALATRVTACSGAEEVTKAMTRALEAAMLGKWDEGEDELRKALETEPENAVIANNLAVVLLSRGKLDEAINLLEGMLKNSPALFVATEPFLYNLATLYELRSNNSSEQKKRILREVAQWGGDGIKTSAMKLPA